MSTLPSLLVFGLLASGSGSAVDDDFYDEPCKPASIATFDMAVCQYQRYKRADRELNRVYRLLLSHLDADQKRMTTSAQRSWLTFRDTDCAAAGLNWAGQNGKERPVVEFSCLADRTEERIRHLLSQDAR